MKTLTIRAIDNRGHSYPVTLTETDRPGFSKKDWILRMEGAGAGWYMTTLESHRGNILAIDFGEGWNCINFGALLAEAVDTLAGEDRITLAEDKAADAASWANLVARI